MGGRAGADSQALASHVVCGQVRQEVLQGARTYGRLRGQGVSVPPSDCLIAAVARRSGLAIAVTDPHLAKIPDVRLVEG